jgi:hypothetical protein
MCCWKGGLAPEGKGWSGEDGYEGSEFEALAWFKKVVSVSSAQLS